MSTTPNSSTSAASGKSEAGKETTPSPEVRDEIVESEHTIVINGQDLRYTTLAGRIAMKGEDEKTKASIFFIAYFKQETPEEKEVSAPRPITFSFNGGPGSSSVWLHLGLLGPRRVLTGDVGAGQRPPYRLADNEYTLLLHSDLVFIDPVSTGYSRAVQGEEAKQFHGLEADIESVGDFIRLFVTRYQRWSSPKFLIGESYGTTRAAGLSGHLQEKHGMYLNGLMLVSVILNWQTASFTPGNDLPYALYLPSYSATAWYHGKLDAQSQADLHRTLAEAEAFAEGDYTLALMQGDRLPPEQRHHIVERLAYFTGLTPDYIERTDLRIEHIRFCKELLRQNRRTVGRLDSRFTGVDRDAAGEAFEEDPSYAFILGAYATAFNGYVRSELNFASDLPYAVLAPLYEKWEFTKHQNQFVDMGETLRKAMHQNPALQVLVANGYYDLATPYFATDYTLHHLGLDAAQAANIRSHSYQAGHMMYVHEASLAQLAAHLAEFVEAAK